MEIFMGSNHTDNGKCTGCGACCSSLLPVSEKELHKIKKYIKKHKILPQKHIDEWVCPFLDISKAKNKCLIYEVRPRICKAFKCDMKMPKKAFMVDGAYDLQEVFFGKNNQPVIKFS